MVPKLRIQRTTLKAETAAGNTLFNEGFFKNDQGA